MAYLDGETEYGSGMFDQGPFREDVPVGIRLWVSAAAVNVLHYPID